MVKRALKMASLVSVFVSSSQKSAGVNLSPPMKTAFYASFYLCFVYLSISAVFPILLLRILSMRSLKCFLRFPSMT